MLTDLCGTHARAWPKAKGFPTPAWKAGRTRLWAGWELWVWLEDTGRIDCANKLYKEIGYLRSVKLRDVVA